MRIFQSTTSKVSVLHSKVLCVLIILSLVGQAVPVLAREPSSNLGDAGTVQLTDRMTDQFVAPQPVLSATPVTVAAQPSLAHQETVTTTVYLPLVLGPRQSIPPTSPYAQMLARVQQVCSATGPNQVCYASGQITLEPKTGTIPFSQPGAIADLVNVQRLSLGSTGSDPQQWSVAWLRLTADSGTPNQELTILAFGNVEISNVVPFTSQLPLEDETVLPGLQFASQPVAGVTKAGSSGLIVANSTEDGVLSLMLNGAAVTLASTALVEAQPGSQMSVTMAKGVSNIEANGQSSVAVQGQQVTMPLNQAGQVSGPPAPAVVVDPLLEYVLDGLLTPLSEEVWQKLVSSVLPRLNRAIDRCLDGQPVYVYNVLFWTRVIETENAIKSRLDPAQLAQAYNRAPRCLTFEVDFDSSATTHAEGWTFSSHLHSQGLRIQFSPAGVFLSGGNQTLVYPSSQYNVSGSPCPVSISTTDGGLEMIGGSLTIVGNGVRISSSVLVSPWPIDSAIANCPSPTPPLELFPKHWWTVFWHMHEDLMDPLVPASYHFTNWHYTGDEHFGEAIYVRSETMDEATFDTTTYLIMIHTPQS